MTKILFGEDARQAMFRGAEIAYNAVKGTLGSRPRCAVLERFDGPKIVDDGATILHNIKPENLFEKMGFDLVKDSSSKTNSEVGDGTTTSAIMSYHLIKGGLSHKNPIVLKKELEESVKIALAKLKEKAISVTTDEELMNIAKISFNDNDIAEIITSSVKKVGENGKIIVEEGTSNKVERQDIDGMELDYGYVSPYMATHATRMESILDNPLVLVTDKYFSLNKDIVGIMKEMASRGKSNLLLVCKKLEAEALQTVLMNKREGSFQLTAIQGDISPDVLEDISALTGAMTITQEGGIKDITMAHLGKAHKVIVSKDKTIIMKDKLDILAETVYSERVAFLKKTFKDTKDKDISSRLARLTGSVVVLKVGGSTPPETTYKKLKVDDAVHAVQAALRDGYVCGGGLTLASICKEVDEELLTKGSQLLAQASSAPIECLITNSGVEVDWEKINDLDGFNTTTGKYEKDIIKSGIIDPVLVTENVLTNSVSLASMFLISEVVAVEEQKNA